ncbi:MAG: ImmA/IrrE family metallo-endopeptidase [Proteobacteria bacterium]|nr:ImmA/IrrE family metallo-endopeptidase [Pseudomonadota bacterium]
MRKSYFLLFIAAAMILVVTPAFAETASGETVTPDGDGPPQYATVEVKGVGAKCAEVVDGVEVVVTNLLKVPMSVELDLYAIGLVDKTAVRDVGSFELMGKASASVLVAAADMPILSAYGATEAFVEATVLFNLFGDPTEATQQSSEFYYRNSPDFEQMMTSTMQVVIDEMGGALWGVGEAKEDDAFAATEDDNVLGIVQDDFGAETVVTKNEAFVELYQDGEYIGRIVGAGMGIGSGGAAQEVKVGDGSAAAAGGSSLSTLLVNPWPKLRFCGKWRVSYNDANLGEDYLPHDTLTYVPAKYTTAKAYKKITIGGYSYWTQVWPSSGWGVLGDDGCIPAAQAIEIVGGAEYKLTMNTWTSDGFNDIYSLPELDPDAGWTDTYSSYYTYYTAPPYYTRCSTPTQCYWTPAMQVTTTGPQVNGTAVAGYVIARQIETGYNPTAGPPGVKTRIYYYNDGVGHHCTGSYYNPGTPNVCIAGSSTSYRWKFTIGHEIGHRVADYYNGPKPEIMNTDGDNISPKGYASPYFEGHEEDCDELCGCDFMGDLCDGNSGMYCWHCLQSRENISVGQGEGFGYIFATWLFNNKNTNAKLVYGKSVWADPLEPPQPAPYSVNAASNMQWMYSTCNNFMDSLGTEWDWVNFFSNVYATKDAGDPESVRYSMEEINLIWNGSDDSHWSNIRQEVIDQYGYLTQKYNQFYDRADDAEVNH